MCSFDKRPTTRSHKLVGIFRRLIGQDYGERQVKTTREQLADRVTSISPPASTHEEVYCPECGIGVLRAVRDLPLSQTVYGHGAFQKLPPVPGSLMCNHCGHIQHKDHHQPSPHDNMLTDAEMDRIIGGVMSTRLGRAIRRR